MMSLFVYVTVLSVLFADENLQLSQMGYGPQVGGPNDCKLSD